MRARAITMMMIAITSLMASIACEMPSEQPPPTTCTEAAARCSLGHGKLGVCMPTGPDQALQCASQH